MQDNYLTSKNLDHKAEQWLELINISRNKQKRFRYDIRNSALFIIDMQEYFLNKKSHAFIPSSKTIIPNINSLINLYRQSKKLIIFTYHALEENEDPGIMERWWNDIIWIKDPLSKISSTLNIDDIDIKIRKNRYSAFSNKNLDIILKKNNIKSILITGVLTHLCCESTARDAFMKDYEVFFVVDATATYTEELHISSLRTLSNGFSIPIRTNQILKRLNKYE